MKNNSKLTPKFKRKSLSSFIQLWASIILVPPLLVIPTISSGLTITENFTGKKTTNKWLLPKTGGGTKPNVACLTAGNGEGSASATTPGSPPRCPFNNEAEGYGALRLTPAQTYQAGGIVSDFDFSTEEGVDITFVTYTYGGTGADGITFFLTDASEPASIGAQGGSLGYSCANASNKGDGIIGGYLALGMDEFGNFLNSGDNTNTGFGFRAGRIGLRGAGSVNFYTLNKKYPEYYPSSMSQSQRNEAIARTCQTGTLWKHNGGNTGKSIMNYPAISGGYVNVNNTTPMWTRAQKRSEARPINYRLKITRDGMLSLWWAYDGGDFQPILVDRKITEQNGELPKRFRFGFVGSTGGSTNNHDITCFSAAPAAISDNSAAVGTPDEELRTGSQIYISTHNPDYWWSSLTSRNLTYNKQTDKVDVGNLANWDASCVLTGGQCNSMGDNVDIKAQPFNERVMMTYNSSEGGLPFRWSSLTDEEKALLNGNDASKGEARLNYLRGDRSLEKSSAFSFRKRISLLGDIINNSSPNWVGPPTDHVKVNKWVDKLNNTNALPENLTSAQSYKDFRKQYNDRPNIIYVGANDGFLHGFRSGAFDSETGNLFKPDEKNPNDGKELLAYMPKDVLKRIHNPNSSALDLSNNGYAHNYFNDATPGVGDVFFANKWHTWLVSGLGAGGQTIYALDITDPKGTHRNNNKFTENNASTIVKGEWSYDPNDATWRNLGNTHGKPEIRRFHNGQWGAIFGNGWCDSKDEQNGNCKAPTGTAGIYVMLLDPNTGRPNFRFLDVGVGTKSKINGIAQVTPVDFDEDHIVDYVYAGDLQGNVWRFDLTSNDPSMWGNSNNITRLFTTFGNQPITTKLNVSFFNKNKKANNTKVMVNFGTGRKFNGYLLSDNTYAKNQHTVYGIWDTKLASWNSKSSKKFATYENTPNITQTNLTAQATSPDGKLSYNEVCWANNNNCKDGAKKYGWYMNFIDSGEQLIYSPVMVEEESTLLLNSFVPGRGLTSNCTVAPASGYTYALDISTGKGKKGIWDGDFTKDPYRLPLGATGSPILVKVNGKTYMVNKTGDGSTTDTKRLYFKNNTQNSIRLLSWRKIF